ncbi:MAG: ABC transporter substrate-binding protein [Burkholderiales bacterium]|nr:ABC transporter substrate-binding protein [Burkholderiales bacterium]
MRPIMVLCIAAAASTALLAQSITIGLGGDITAFDPHYHNVGPNNAATSHVFERLVAMDERQRLTPGLALSWKAIDDLNWEFKLRRGVKWHDGSEFTAEDALFSFDRVPKVPNSPSSFSTYVRPIKSAKATDPYTLLLTTEKPHPLLPNDLSTVSIVSKKAASGAATEDFNSGKAAIGTGPYKFVRFAKGDRVELARNDAWWGGKTPWEKATLRILTNDPARVAALLAGDVQAIENVPTADMSRVKSDKNLSVARVGSNRLIYLHLDSNRDVSPFVTDKQGKPLANNPLKDPRVRKAISLALNRDAIVSRVMESEAVAAGQPLPDGYPGTSKNLKPDKFDAAQAKKLLSEAGYPDGFGITIHAPNNRYVNDEQIAQAVAQMLTRAGIATKVDAMPSSVYFTRATKLDFSLMLLGWSAGSGEMSDSLRPLLGTFDAKKGWGNANRGRYSNGKFDAMLDDALVTINDAKREALLARATEIAMADQGIVPLHFQMNTWATRKNLTYTPRTDEYTLAWMFKPVAK